MEKQPNDHEKYKFRKNLYSVVIFTLKNRRLGQPSFLLHGLEVSKKEAFNHLLLVSCLFKFQYQASPVIRDIKVMVASFFR